MKPILLSLYMICCLFAVLSSKAQLSASFTANITSGCSPIVVNFSDQSTGNPSEWRWDLGNGTLSTLQHPSATYFAPGLYTIRLWIRSGNNTDSVVRTSYIHVFSSPTVDFGSDITNGCSPLIVNFNDHTVAGSGTIVSRQWDFGDGILSAQENPQHIYALAGNYNVTLKAINSNGCAATARKSSYITNSYAKARFINWSAGGCLSNKIFFQNESTGSSSLVYHWDFGDGTFSSAIAPVHIYPGGGSYSVKLVVRNETCTDSFSKNITVAPPVTASFTSDRHFSCKAPANIQFTNQTSANAVYFWDFGDGTTSSAVSPAHTYGDAGIYSVKFVIKNNAGCADSLVMNNYIDVRKTYVNMVTLPDSGCAPFTKQFSAYIDSRDSIINMYWKIGNTVTLQGSSPVYTFNNTGFYDVSVITNTSIGCIDTTTILKAITIGEKPTARFSADILNACASTGINFTDLSEGNITYREWRFGDRATSNEENPSHIYKDTGWMTVTLVVGNAGCTDSITYNRYIYIKPPIAKYKTAVDCDSPYQRRFENLSIGGNRWQWNFGDGDTSNEFEPLHIFPHTGNFPVTLKVWDDETGCSNIFKKNIKIADVAVLFSASDTDVCKKQSIVFTGQPSPDIVHYYWEFGDGTYFDSPGNNANHAYESSGTYSIKLLVKDSTGCLDTLLKQDYVIVKGPTAGFSASITDICINTPVYFTDLSFGNNFSPIRKWEWNYGDGRVDTVFAPPFSHTYTVSGSYGVALKVTDSTGCTDAAWLPQRITAGKISSAFIITDSVACPGYALRFKCPFTATNISYLWDFGDGTTSSVQNPLHSYVSEGSYTVKLYVRKQNSCIDSTVIINAVKIKQTRADFTISDSFTTCPPLLVRFDNNAVNALSEYWDFGDSTYSNAAEPSHYYVYPGIYKAVHYVKGNGACVDTVKKTIIVKGPTGNITSDVKKTCWPYEYNFIVHTQNAISYVWDFDDGVTQIGNDSTVNHVYTEAGNFVPKIILEDNAGCRVPVPSKDTLKNISVNPYFTFSDSTACMNDNISFTGLSVSNDSIVSFAWNFGDSTTSDQKNTTHQYSVPGIYYPSLKVITAYGCSNIYHSTGSLKVATLPVINMVTTGSGCAPLQVIYHAFSTGADSSLMKWNWSMANGDTSSLQHPPAEIYHYPGDYTVSVSATNNDGCSSIARDVTHVLDLPVTKISGDSAVCKGSTIALHASGAKQYTWLPAVNVSCDTCISITVNPVVNTEYMLKGVSENGCVSVDTFMVNVYQPVQLQYRPSENICTGQSATLNVTGAGLYKWSPPYAISSTTSSNPVVKPDSTIEYVVVGSDIHKCFNDTGKIRVKVSQYPFVKACEDKTITAGTPASLEAVYSDDVTEAYWFPNDNTSRYDPHSITVKPAENTEYTIKVKNSGGCIAEDRVTVFVTCNKNNVFVPNLFSPNNDGVNDVFYPRGTGLLKIQTLRIYNRWGETVFEKKGFNANDPSAGWDGTYKGTTLVSDVFVYVMDLVCENSSVLSLKGNISLVK